MQLNETFSDQTYLLQIPRIPRTRKYSEKVRQILETLRIVAMTLGPKTWADLRNAGVGEPDSSGNVPIPNFSEYLEIVSRSGSLAARAA